MRTLLTCWLLALVATAALAQDRLPFVDAFGVVGAELRRSAVVQELGPPPVETEGRQLAYPARGLVFDLEPDSGRDPRVGRMVVGEPSRAATPGGLHVGQERAAALKLVDIDYRREPSPGTPDPDRLFLSERDGGPQARRVQVAFSGGRVSRITFFPQGARAQTPTPARGRPIDGPSPMVAAVLVAAGVLGLLFRPHRKGRWVLPPAWRAPLGAVAVAGGLGVAALGWSALRGGNPYGSLAGLMLGLGGAGVAFIGLLLLATAPQRVLAWPARVLLVLLFGAMFADKLGWFG